MLVKGLALAITAARLRVSGRGDTLSYPVYLEKLCRMGVGKQLFCGKHKQHHSISEVTTEFTKINEILLFAVGPVG